MRWSDIQFDPPRKVLRQFAGLCLVFFGGGPSGKFWDEDEQDLGRSFFFWP